MGRTLTGMTLRRLRELIENPSGVWADFNILYRGWKIIRVIAEDSNCKCGLYCLENVPPEPDPADYTDLDAESTIDPDKIGFGDFPMKMFYT